MDFQKAFDRVWHHGLLYKLAAMGVGKYSLTWLRSYLTSREIVVRFGTARSDPYTLRTGVPQGSHLGPVLFLVFNNDLPQIVDLPTGLYADDALIHKCNFNLTDNSIRSLQDAVDIVLRNGRPLGMVGLEATKRRLYLLLAVHIYPRN